MAKILGLDLGTNSIGWAFVETSNNKDFISFNKGVSIFLQSDKTKPPKNNEPQQN